MWYLAFWWFLNFRCFSGRGSVWHQKIRELTLRKKAKIPVLGAVEAMSGFIYFYCSVSVILQFRVLFGGKTQGDTPIYGLYIGLCRGIGYNFWGSQSLNRISFLPLLKIVTFTVWSLDRVPTRIVSANIAANKHLAKHKLSSMLDAFKPPVSQMWHAMPFIVFVFSLNWMSFFFVGALRVHHPSSLNRVRVLRPFAAHLWYLWGTIAWN